jgi:L-asparaginase
MKNNSFNYNSFNYNSFNHKSIQYIFLAIIICIIFFYTVCYIYNKFYNYKGTEFFSSTITAPEKRRILILYTGGTIGMVESKDGNIPKKGFLKSQLNKILSMHKNRKEISPFTIKEYSPLLDSSNMDIRDWNKMITDIRDNYDDYDSFIVIHGTDTLAYTASALSFAFENLSKPIIVTGSQIPLEQLKNDGGTNLLASLIVASSSTIPEVMVVFSNKIIRGNRSKKISSNKLNAFESPNIRNIGNFGYSAQPNYNKGMIRDASMGFFSAQLYDEKKEVIIIYLTPGFNFKNVETVIAANPNIRGVILQTFGIGDGPTGNDNFLHMLKALNNKGIVILNISQCIEGHIDTGDYETGSTMVKYNVISGNDMTLEAGYCKLLYLLTKLESGEQLYSNSQQVENELVRDLRGELSEKSTSFEFL